MPRMRIVPELSLPRLLTQKSDQRMHKIEQTAPVLPGGHSSEDVAAIESQMQLSNPVGRGSLETAATEGHSVAVGKKHKVTGGGLSVGARLNAQQYNAWHATVACAAGTLGKSPAIQEEDDDQAPDVPQVPESFPGTCEAGGSTSSEFMRRRRVHPRLRWPRLASRSHVTGAAYSADVGTGIVPHNSSVEKDDQRTINNRQLAHQESNFGGTAVVLGMKAASPPGSTTNSSVALGPKMNSSSSSASMARSLAAPTPRPAILPRAKAHRPVEAGTTSTLSAPLPEDTTSSRPSTRLGGASSELSGTTSSLSLMTPSPSAQLSSRASSTASKASSCDRKWFMRVAPISCLPAERSMKAIRQAFQTAHPEHVHGRFAKADEPSLSLSGEYLSFARWGLNDDYIEALLSAHESEDGRIRMRGVKHLNLSENQITERGVTLLMEQGMPESILSLNLSCNLLRERGGLAVVDLLARCRHLTELDLEGNLIGDLAAEELCGTLDHQCPQLEGLSLAQCNIGTGCRGGIAIGNYLALAHQLTKLDLHWNSLHGEGARALLKGVYANGVENSGKLTGLNLAWNRLGSGTQQDSAKKREAGRVAKILSRVFQDGKTLFHLDLSYNGIDAEDCAVLAGGLLKNHTLFGIHLVGNEATLDDYGFVVPISRTSTVPTKAPRANLSTATPRGEIPSTATPRGLDADGSIPLMDGEAQQNAMNSLTYRGQKRPKSDVRSLQHNPSLASFGDSRVNALSNDDVGAERKWILDRQRVKLLMEMTDSEAVQRNVQCCWICENWVEHKVIYTPGISGAETAPGQVQSIYALYSIDGFARPTHLTKQEEMYTRRSIKLDVAKASIMMPAHHSRLSYLSADTQRRKSQLAQGAISPPPGERRERTRTPVINAHGRIEKWVGMRMLPPTLEPLEVVFVVNDLVKVLDDLEKKTLQTPKTITLVREDDDEPQVETVEVKVVNVVPTGLRAWDKFRQGTEIGLCIMEDPDNRGDLTIMPRKLFEMSSKTAQDTWTFETSTFKDFIRDNNGAVDKCFEMDWNHCRVPMLVKTDEARSEIYKAFKSHGQYLPFILTFWNEAFSHTVQHRSPVGLSKSGFQEYVAYAGGVGNGKLIDGTFCKSSDPDCVFSAANVVPTDRRARFKLLPEKGLARFQFFEAVVRLAFRRYLGNETAGGPHGYMQAIDSLLNATRLGQDMVGLRRSLHTRLFTEECCQVYKEYLDILKVVFEGYAMIRRYPGRSGKMMSFGAWTELLVDTGVMDSGEFTHQQIGVAFALGKEIRPDEYSSWRYMELSWGEFLVALGAVVRLSPAYKKEIVADLLDEFFSEHVEEAHTKVLNKRLGTARTNRNLDEQMAPLVRFLERLFQDADEDRSGTVDQHEFRQCLGQMQNIQEMASLGLPTADIDMVFRMIDKDGTGEITLDDLVEGFIRMKLSMRGEERAISFIRNTFTEMDADGSGTLDVEEFHTLITQPNALRKLSTLGVTDFDVACIFDLVDEDCSGGVNVEQVITGLLRLRDPGYAAVRGLRLLQELFEEADVDGDGGLSKSEVLACYNAPEVMDKFKRLMLKVPPWAVLFEELDVDCSGDLSWEEIDAGMKSFWERPD